MSLYSFRTYFFTQCELQAPFSNLLTTANNYKKNLVSLYNFRSYFFPLGDINGSFSKLLTRANNYTKILSDFF